MWKSGANSILYCICMCKACFHKKNRKNRTDFLGFLITFPIALLALNLKAGATENDTNA
jgi:hypothetical protein